MLQGCNAGQIDYHNLQAADYPEIDKIEARGTVTLQRCASVNSVVCSSVTASNSQIEWLIVTDDNQTISFENCRMTYPAFLKGNGKVILSGNSTVESIEGGSILPQSG